MATIIDMPPGADIFKSEAQILVNPVNAQGRIGAGLAQRFKVRWPAANAEFCRACYAPHAKDDPRPQPLLRGGSVVLIACWDAFIWIAFFCTKRAPEERSDINYIKQGMTTLRLNLLYSRRARHIAIPALGCGLGGLNWHEVRPVIVAALQDIEGLTVELYPPHE